jgi:hypothetical protein
MSGRSNVKRKDGEALTGGRNQDRKRLEKTLANVISR